MKYGLLLVRESVEVAPYGFQTIQYFQGRAFLCPLKSGMLAEMCQAILALAFVAGASPYAYTAIDDGRVRHYVNHPQSVLQCCRVVFHLTLSAIVVLLPP